MATRKTLNFLPEIFKSNVNKKFLGATLDQLISEPELLKINGFVGRKFSPLFSPSNKYLLEPSADRTNYQFEPAVVVKNNNNGLELYSDYKDLISKIGYYGGLTDNHDRLFKSEYYRFDPRLDLDKFVNFTRYYWMPVGPTTVQISSGAEATSKQFTMTRGINGYNTNYTGLEINPVLTLLRGVTYQFELDQPGHKFWIQTEPGTDGLRDYNQTVSSRDIFGVDNNGEENGIITFTVPLKSAQDNLLGMPLLDFVSYAVEDAFSAIDGIIWNQGSSFIDNDTRYPNGSYLIFVHDNTDNNYWVDFDGSFVSNERRTGLWKINVHPVTRRVRLEYVRDLAQNTRIVVNHGSTDRRGYEYYRNSNNTWVKISPPTAPLSVLYYQDGNNSNFKGTIKIVDNPGYQIDVEADIIGKANYTSSNGVVFTNGLKVSFDDSVIPAAYRNKTYIVEGTGVSILLVDFDSLDAIESLSPELTIPWDTNNFDIDNFDQPIKGSVDLDYIVVNRGSRDGNAWSRANRWFHEDVIRKAAEYNGITVNIPQENRAQRPIIEFEENLQLFNYGREFLGIVDRVDEQVRDENGNTTELINALEQINGRSLNDQAIEYLRFVEGQLAIFPNDLDFAIRSTIYAVGFQDLSSGSAIADALPGTGVISTSINSTRVLDASAREEQPKTSFREELTIGTTLYTQDGLFIGKVKGISNNNELVLENPPTASYAKIAFKYNSPRIELTAVTTAQSYDSVAVRTGLNARKSFWFNGSNWSEAQSKTSKNQSPLFDVIDINDTSYSDNVFYPQTTFTGTKVFSYKLGTGSADSVLGFPLSYGNLGTSLADISFDNYFDSDTFTYKPEAELTSNISTGYLRKNIDRFFYDRINVWSKVSEPSKQYQHISHNYNGKSSYFEIDVLPATEIFEPNFKVFVNNKLISPDTYTIESVGARMAVKINSTLVTGDYIDIIIYSDNTSKLGYYRIPSNLEFNAQNILLQSITLGQIRGHWSEIGRNTRNLSGDPLSNNNLRDLDTSHQPGVVLQHSAPTMYSSLFLIDPTVNFMNGIELARRDYTKFKNKFLELCVTLPGLDPNNPADGVEHILKTINGVKNATFPWHYTDMVPWNQTFVSDSYTVIDFQARSYSIGNVYFGLGDDIYPDRGIHNKAVLVYLNGNLLIADRDYTIFPGSPSVVISESVTINAGDRLLIKGYPDTDGSYVPETPTKLGLHPKFIPEKILDNTYREPIEVIQGHDGSLTPAFGDLRDTYLLELEKRIYNNLKIEYNKNIFDTYSVIPGKFRQTDYSITEFNQVVNTEFLKWIGTNQLDFSTNEYFQPNDQFSWNYNQTDDSVNGEKLLGYWRGIYKYFYDTDRPHVAPWEMLGYFIKPTWWDNEYGTAPYTNTNAMWADLEIGFSRGENVTLPTFARPGLSKIIPVDNLGNLVPPQASLVRNFDGTKFSQSYAIGDHGPVESAWRRSSEFPFALQRALSLLAPAKYFGLLFDTTAYIKDTVLDQYVLKGTNRRVTTNVIVVNGETKNGTISRARGYINWIHGYLTNLGIDAATRIRQSLDRVDIKLGYKVAGYTDKNYMTVLAEQFSPTSTNESVIVPNENYIVHLNKSAPIRRAVYSAVIVEKTTTGYSVKGYNLKFPYFTIIPSEYTSNSYTIESLDARAVIFKDFKNQKINVPYGFEFKNTQQVVDFLVSYERYLTSQGFVFNSYDSDLDHLKDWVLSALEFLTWSQQGWTPGNVLVLSPVSYELSIFGIDAVIDAITNQPNDSQLLGPNFNVVRSDEISVLREPTLTTITVISGQTIAFADLNLVQYEHALVFDNTTVFNDIVYKPELGSRQYRLKLIGNRTGSWNGALNPPGFIYNTGVIDEWKPETDYKKGDIVKFKNQNYTSIKDIPGSAVFDFDNWSILDTQIEAGLIPNFATNANKFIDMYDIDSQSIDEEFDIFASGLIGYRSRPYLEDLGMDQTAQSKFYQGYIKQKGTKKSISSLYTGQFDNMNNDVFIFEEWGLRVGEYGALRSDYSIDMILDEENYKGNPAVFKLLNSSEINREPVLTVRPKELLNRPLNYKSPIFLNRPLGETYETDVKTSGYVNLNDVDMQLFDFSNFKELTTTALANLTDGYLIWVAKDFNKDWQVYKVIQSFDNAVTEIGYSLDNKIVITTRYDHGLQVGDVFAVRDFNPLFDGFHQVLNVETPNTIVVIIDAVMFASTSDVIYEGAGSLFSLQKSRYSTEHERDADITRRIWSADDYVWLDNFPNNIWSVCSFVRGETGSFSGSKSFWGIENGAITMRAEGLPYHTYGNLDIPVTGTVQNFNRSWPLYAGSDVAATTSEEIGTGLIGFALNGVPIYSPDGGEFRAPGDYLVLPDFSYNLAFSDYGVFNQDLAGGIISDNGQYFYRSYSFARAWETGLGTNETTSSVGIPETASTSYLNGGLQHSDNHSKIIGFALDGYPIYGPIGYSDPLDSSSPFKRMESGYVIRSSDYRASTEACNLSVHPMGMLIQDYVFNGNGDLDMHNGRYCVTPDYPNGTYAYFATVNIQNNPVYPYFIGPTYYGSIPKVGNSLSAGPGIAPFGFSSYVDVEWTTIKQQQPAVDIRSIGGMYLFNNIDKNILTRIDFIDPAKGRVLGTAQADIDFLSGFDPAKYNQGTIEELSIDTEYHWGQKQVGMVWWDLDSARYYNYEQSDLEYRISHWGKTFPGSNINVYEWVESNVLPSEYIGLDGTPKYANDDAYVELSYVEPNTGIMRSKYYFWVRGKQSIGLSSKSHSVFAIEQMIENPVLQNIPYAAVLRDNSIALFNVGKFLSGKNTGLHIDYRTSLTENMVHSEFELFQEGNEFDVMNPRIEDKLIDSLVGANIDNQLVPDPSLLPGDRIGLSLRPRQTLINNRLRALENALTFVNSVMIRHPVASRIINNGVIFSDNFYASESIPEETEYDFAVDSFSQLDFVPEIQSGFFVPGKQYVISDPASTDFIQLGSPDNNIGTRFTALGVGTGDGYAYPSRVLVRSDANYNRRWTVYKKNVSGVASSLLKIQTFNSTNFWSTVDWYSDGYSKQTMVVDFIVDTFNDIYTIGNLAIGNIVQIKDNGGGIFEIYKNLGANKFQLIALEKGTVQISPELWKPIGFDHFNWDTDPFDYNYFTEVRKIIMGIKQDIFVRDLALYWNKFLFYVIEYILSEQKYVDWIFKTSFVSISHRLEGLIQTSSFVKDRQSFYEQYIREVKPYRSKIREYSMTYSGMDVLNSAAISDFDLPAYYDTDLQMFRSPNGLLPLKDAEVLNTRPEYQDWKNNYTYHIENLEIAEKSRGFVVNPDISIVKADQTGSGASARATIAGANGSITKVYMNSVGENYTLTPKVYVTGSGASNMSKYIDPSWKPAKLVPRLANSKIRKIKTVLKFDRIGSTITGSAFSNYGSKVVDWQSNTAYPAGSHVSYQGQGYRSVTNVPPVAFFDNSGFQLVNSGEYTNASDRINAYYNPTTSMVPKVLSRLMTGLDNQALQGNTEVLIDTAIQGGGFTGVAVRAGSFEVGEKYIITDLGNKGFETDFILVGAYENQIGLLFTANSTGIGNGTGSAAIAIYAGDAGGVAGTAPEDINIEGGAFVYETFSHAPEEMLPGRVYDAISVVSMDEANTGFRIFVNMNNQSEASSISPATSTELAQALKATDTTISVVDGTILSTPNPFGLVPGVIYINAERIEYYSKENNTLGQLRRGVGGTSIPMEHATASKVENGSNPEQLVLPLSKIPPPPPPPTPTPPAPPPPPPPPPSTFSLTTSAGRVDEGDVVTITLSTTNVDDDTLVPFTISGISVADISAIAVNGVNATVVNQLNFRVTGGISTVDISIALDFVTGESENMILSLNNDAASIAVEIVEKSPQYTLTKSVDSVNEDGTVEITLSTLNVADNVRVAFVITGISLPDISGMRRNSATIVPSLSSYFEISASSATIALDIIRDNLPREVETIVLTLVNSGESISIPVIDKTYEYQLSSNIASVAEGNTAVVTLNTINVPNGTQVPFTIEGITIQDISNMTRNSQNIVVALSSYFEVYSNVSTLGVTIASDEVQDEVESFTVRLNGRTENVQVAVNEFSPSYTLTSDVTTIYEGSTVTFTLDTVNVLNGTNVPFAITGIDAEDIQWINRNGANVQVSTVGFFTIQSNRSTVQLQPIRDSQVESPETMVLALTNGRASASVVIRESIPLTVAPGTLNTTENRRSAVFTVDGGNPGDTLTITFDPASTALSGFDFVSVPQFSIDNGGTWQQYHPVSNRPQVSAEYAILIRVLINRDTITESLETIIMRIAASSGDSRTVTINLTDD